MHADDVLHHPDLGLGDVEIEAPAIHPALHEDLGQFLGVAQHGQEGGGFLVRLPVQGGLDLVVGQAGLAFDHGVVEPGLAGLAVQGIGRVHDHGQSRHVRAQAAQAVGQGLGEHGLHRQGEIVGIAPRQGLRVQGRALGHVVGHVGDGHHQAVAVLLPFHVDRVVEILGRLAVDGDQGQPAQVAAAFPVLRGRLVRQGLGLAQDRGREGLGDGIPGLDQELLGGQVALHAQAAQGRAAPQALFLLLLRRHAQDVPFFGVRDGTGVDHGVEGHARIRGVAEIAVLMDAAGDAHQQFARGALQHLHHPAFRGVLLAPGVHHGRDPVAGPGPAEIAGVDEEVLLFLVVGQKVAHAGAAHVQGAGHARQGVHQAVALAHLHDLAALDHLGQGGFDDFLQGGVGVEEAVDVLAAQGRAGLAQDGEQVFLGKFGLSLFFRGHVGSRVGCERRRPASRGTKRVPRQ